MTMESLEADLPRILHTQLYTWLHTLHCSAAAQIQTNITSKSTEIQKHLNFISFKHVLSKLEIVRIYRLIPHTVIFHLKVCIALWLANFFLFWFLLISKMGKIHYTCVLCFCQVDSCSPESKCHAFAERDMARSKKTAHLYYVLSRCL
jgi:hypothetical protein